MTTTIDTIELVAKRRGRLADTAAHLVVTLAGTAKRAGQALHSFADAGQLGPDPQVVLSRWTGGRI
jgi:hypothetical protein